MPSLPETPSPESLAEALLSQTVLAPYRHEGRPCLLLSLPGFLTNSRENFALVTEADGSLKPRSFHTDGAPIASILRENSAPRDDWHVVQLAAFTDGQLGIAPPSTTLGQVARSRTASAVPASRRAWVEASVAEACRASLRERIEAALDAAGFDPGHREALRTLVRFRDIKKDLADLLLGPDRPWRRPVAEACAAHPLLVELAPVHGMHMRKALRDLLAGGADGFIEICARRAPGLTRARAARLGGLGLRDLPDTGRSSQPSFDGFLALLADAPSDWIRPDPEQVAAMAALSDAYLKISTLPGTDRVALLRPARGDWRGMLDRCRAVTDAARGSVQKAQDFVSIAAGEAGAPVAHFARGVLLPVLARSEPPGDGVPVDWEPRCLLAARALLYADKGMPAVLGAVMDWHARANRIEERMPKGARASWPAPCAPFTASNGVAVRPLTSAAELVAEGAAGVDADGVPGLAHCVATYHAIAESGRSHILSVRGPDGKRLSTVELKVDDYGRGKVAQHKGIRNTAAPPEAVRAMGEFVTSVRLPRPAEPGPDARPTQVGVECGYDHRNDALVRLAAMAYAEFLPRNLRDADLDALAAHAGFVAPAPEPGPDDAPAPSP